MTDSNIVDFMMNTALVIMVFLLIPASWRMIKGPRIADRLLALDLITTLLVGTIVVLAYIEEQVILIDVAIAVAALAFIATISVSRFVSEGRVF